MLWLSLPAMASVARAVSFIADYVRRVPRSLLRQVLVRCVCIRPVSLEMSAVEPYRGSRQHNLSI